MAQEPKPGRELRIVAMVNQCGFVLMWNCYDYEMIGRLYGARWYWRNVEPRTWVQFRWNTFGNGHTSLAYDQGRKYRKVVGWELRGPLLRWTETT